MAKCLEMVFYSLGLSLGRGDGRGVFRGSRPPLSSIDHDRSHRAYEENNNEVVYERI